MNLVRMGIYLVLSDSYTIRAARAAADQPEPYFPMLSVVIPAHNEQSVVLRALQSIYASDYPAAQLEVVVADDGSTDQTRQVVLDFIRGHGDRCDFRIVSGPNRGKAGALNEVMRSHTRGEILVCLDADSYFAPDALRNAAQYFRDPDVVTLSSNVNIVEDGTVLALVQRFEYLTCYQMKKGQALVGIEYIVGGIGSMFRRAMLDQIDYYDSNTMTEDIDLTMKILQDKTRSQKIAYAADSIVYTEPVHSVGALMNQRFRWKYGRTQTFYKHRSLFFSRQERHARRVCWFMLPFALVQDVLFFFEPFVLAYFLYLTIRYDNISIFVSALAVLTVYTAFNVWATGHLSVREKLRLTLYSPPMYLCMYVLGFAEYFALIKGTALAPRVRGSIAQEHVTWSSPPRQRQGDLDEAPPSKV